MRVVLEEPSHQVVAVAETCRTGGPRGEQEPCALQRAGGEHVAARLHAEADAASHLGHDAAHRACVGRGLHFDRVGVQHDARLPIFRQVVAIPAAEVGRGAVLEDADVQIRTFDR